MNETESKDSAAVAVYEHHPEAANAVNLLWKNGFSHKELTIIGKGYYSEDNVIGCYTTGDGAKHWGKAGTFWGGVWGLLAPSAFFVIPGVGPIAVAGSAVTWITGALDGSTVVPDLSALGAALCSIGIPSDSAVKYESAINAGKYLLIAHGKPQEAESARRILNTTGAQEISTHGRDQPAMAAAA